MSTFEVRFINNSDDTPDKHKIMEVEASNHNEAFNKALESEKSLSSYGFYSVEIKRY